MAAVEAADEAILESVVFLDHFADLPDPRQLSKVIYPLDEILLLSLYEPPRDCRRLQLLRGRSHDDREQQQVFT